MSNTNSTHQNLSKSHFIAGVTLIELTLVMVIIGIMGSISAPIAVQFIQGNRTHQIRTSLTTEANIAITKMRQRIANTADNTDSNFVTSTNSIDVPVEDNKVYQYQINNGDLEQTVDSTTSVLSPHASSLQFDYYDVDGNTTTTNSDTYYVKVTLTLSKDNESVTTRRLIFLRNPGYDH